MSKLTDGSVTIYDALQNIKAGKYVMPAFQRQFVWEMDRIEKLWDSILLDYPIATFLFWHIDDNNVTWDTYFCNFLSGVVFDSKKKPDSNNYELTSINTDLTDTAILDGQQRLNSLFVSLMGEAFIRPNYARKTTGAKIYTKLLIELNKNKISVDEEEYNSKKYDIRFTDKVGKVSPTQFEVKTILTPGFKNVETRKNAIEGAIVNVPTDSKDYARGILQKLCTKVFEEKLIRFTEISDMNQDDALEMFVRFNNGGRPLRKAEITMSILEAYWPSAKTEFGRILSGGYADFDTDFIIRTALMLYGDVLKSNISKKTADDLKNNWSAFKQMLEDLKKLLAGWKINVSRFAGSWNVLLPIAFLIYYNPRYMDNEKAIKAYLLRAIFFTYFQSGTTGKLQQMKSNILDYDYEITFELLDQINELRVTDGKIEDVVSSEKGSRVAGEVLYYLSLDWAKNWKYEQDHLHPFARFDESRPTTVTAEDWKRWRAMRNRLPNLHLLVGRPNASKGEMRLIDYYNDMDETQQQLFYTQAMIPEGVSLELDDFETFYNERKKLLVEKIRSLVE